MDTRGITHVGLILVHGIGEQKRFEHLDLQGRQIVRALKCANPGQTVEIEAPEAAAFHAEQSTWGDLGDGPVQVVIGQDGQVTTRVHIHEVWWADINETYSIPKQARFWFWGLGLWLFPRASGPSMPGQASVARPVVPDAGRWWFQPWLRTRIFFVSMLFALGGATLGLALSLAQRVLNLHRVPLLRLLTNYMSAVKLYLQASRHGQGLFPPNNLDFLDTLDQPPRVSLRRRMIRTIAQVALRDHYDRWYIVAHSQGTVLALNGLLEIAEAWPGYFTEQLWGELRNAGLCGDPKDPPPPPGAPAERRMPPTPAWNVTGEVAYRQRIFRNFHGLVTLGCPAEKFAAIWPERVSIALEPAFRKNTLWLNVFDPLDPVSGTMDGFQGQHPALCPRPTDIGYPAYPLLLVAHTHYLNRCGGNFLADGVAHLLMTGQASGIYGCNGSFRKGDARYIRRWLAAQIQLVLVFALLLALATAEALYFWPKVLAVLDAIWVDLQHIPAFLQTAWSKL